MAERLGGFTVPLSALRRGDVQVAGGKGANLGELIHAGAPVPAGFVLTCAAYDAHLHHSGLAGRVTELLAAAPDGSQLRDAIRTAAPPESVRKHLRQAYTELVGDPVRGAVAVRSSASAEDLPTAAMAGQHETVLNVVGVPALIDAVRECWASLWTQRAIDYRQRRCITNEAMAVVVQRMVPAETAGVMFTANPLTGARDEIVVDAAAGLGEAVVSGLVTPDHLVLDKRTGRVRSARPGRREVLIRARPGGGTEKISTHATDDRDAPLPAPDRLLADVDLRLLARLGSRVERQFGAPQDIEWAWYRGRPYLLQSRPVTALPPPPPRRAYERMFAALVAEVLPIRPYPLDVTTWLGSLLATAARVTRDLGLGSRVLGELVVYDGVVVAGRPPVLRPTWRLLLLPARIRRWSRRPPTDDTAAWEAMIAPIRALGNRDLTTASWPQLVATLRSASAVPPSVIEYRLRGLADAASLLWLIAVLWLTRRLDLLGDLLSGTDNKTAETGRALDALATNIRSQPALAALFADHPPAALPPLLAEQHPEFLADFHDFLDRYGHRGDHQPTARHPADLARRPGGGAGAAPGAVRYAAHAAAAATGVADRQGRTAGPPTAATGAGASAGRPVAGRSAPGLPSPRERPVLPHPRAAGGARGDPRTRAPIVGGRSHGAARGRLPPHA